MKISSKIIGLINSINSVEDLETLSISEVTLLNRLVQYSITKDFKSYCDAYIRYNGQDFHKWEDFHYTIIDNYQKQLDAILRGELSILTVEVHAQSGKTLIASLFLTYVFGRFPNFRTGYYTYNEERGKELMMNILRMITLPFYQRLFPYAKIKSMYDYDELSSTERKGNKSTDKVLTNVCGSGSICTGGINSTLTGRPFEILVIDDTIKNADMAKSQVLIDNINNNIFSSVITRSQVGGTALIFIQTRWKHDDAIGYLLGLYATTTITGLPKLTRIVFEAKYTGRFNNSEYDHREIGEYLWAEFSSKYALAQLKPDEWQSLYQQSPELASLQLMRPEYIQYYHHKIVDMGQVFISVDTNSNAQAKAGDDFAITVWFKGLEKICLLEFVSQRYNYIAGTNKVKELIRKYSSKLGGVIIEAKANGQALYEQLSFDLMSYATIIQRFDPTPYKSKLNRLSLVMHLFEQKLVYFPDYDLCPDIDQYISQLLNFTGEKGKKDDLVDTTSQFMLLCCNDFYMVQDCELLYDITSPNNPEITGNVVQEYGYKDIMRLYEYSLYNSNSKYRIL